MDERVPESAALRTKEDVKGPKSNRPHPPLDIYFCDSTETAISLAGAGYGIALVPELLQNQDQEICQLPIMDADPMSYGVYYKTLSEHPRRKAFVEVAKEIFSQESSK